MKFNISRTRTFGILLLCMLIVVLCVYLYERSEIPDPVLDTVTSGLIATIVTEVVDGDTITVSGGERVRLIGIDSPEFDEDYYQESKKYLTDRILQREIKLESDVEDKDRYGRSLRYVWLEGKLINSEIVREGLAIAKQYGENNKYQHLIADAEKEAIEKRIMIWTAIQATQSNSSNAYSPTTEIISYLDVKKYIGEIKTVEGTIVETSKYRDGGIIFLNFHDPHKGYLTVVIWSDDWDKFPQSPEIYYKNKKVRVTGEIIEHEGLPEIVVRDLSHIKIVT